MWKELLFAGMLSFTAYSQVQIGHNPEIEQKGNSECYWQYVDPYTGYTCAKRQATEFSITEKMKLTEIISDIPLRKKIDSLNYPIHIAKGVTISIMGEMLTEKNNKFSEILLDTTLFSPNLKKISKTYGLEIDITESLFQREVVLHELVHSYYGYTYGHIDNPNITQNSRKQLFNSHCAALGVECIYLAEKESIDTKLYTSRMNELMYLLYPKGYVLRMNSKEEEIKKIRGYMKNLLEPEDYKFLFE